MIDFSKIEQYRENNRIEAKKAPGGFRIEIDAAKSGGVSDPRNGALLKMFNLIDIGERAGSGIPNIFRVWREQGWVMPAITEQLEPERTILALCFGKTADKNSCPEGRGHGISDGSYQRQQCGFCGTAGTEKYQS